MITGLLFGISFILGDPVPGTVYLLTSLIDGFIFLPVFSLVVVPMAGRIGREKFGRFHFMQTAAPFDTLMLVLTPWGYEVAPVTDRSNDPANEDLYYTLSTGQEVNLNDEQTWYRLGNRRFGVTYVPDQRVMGNAAIDVDNISLETVVVENPDGEPEEQLAIYGGYGILPQKRGTFRGYTPVLSEPDEGFIISLSRVINSLRGGGGVRLSEHTERMTRMEYGGGATLSNKSRALGFVGVILIGSVIGTLIFGVLG